MRLVTLVRASVLGCAVFGGVSPLTSAQEQSTIVVRGPTVVAFFPVTQSEVDKDPDTNESLADFQYYANKVRDPLHKAGIEFHELYGRSFRVQTGKRVTAFRPAKEKVGYLLVAPGKKRRIEYGVLTADDLLHVANEYFGVSAK